MYFELFPLTYYSLYDDKSNIRVVTNITTRVAFTDEAKNKLAIYDEYDVRDGETPEIVADKFYNDPQLHWLVLHTNDILDPRFEWPLSTYNLQKYVEGKYSNVNGVHHYEDGSGNIVEGNVILNSSAGFSNLHVGNVITNQTGSGIGVVSVKVSSSNIFILATTGGFASGDQVSLYSNTQVNANITATVTISGTPFTNFNVEDEENETKRRIRVLKPEYVIPFVQDFKRKLEL